MNELDELSSSNLNSLLDFNNQTWKMQHRGPTEMCIHLGSKKVVFILFVDGINSTNKVQTYTLEVTCDVS